MDYKDIIDSKYSEPAAVLLYKNGNLELLHVNDRFIPEYWMNIRNEEFDQATYDDSFDERNRRILAEAVEQCATTGKETEIETWRNVSSDCCGHNKICIKSRLLLIDKTSDGVIIYEGIRNISNEKWTQTTLEDVEYRYKSTSEQVNIYNWEYIIETKEMHPCFRCMRDLGVPAVVRDYPEPVIDAGIFPPDYADMYREMMRKVDEGIPEIEADIPLTVGRIPFRVRYTNEFDENGKPVRAFGSATFIPNTEEKLKLNEQIIQTLAEGYQCIYVADFIRDAIDIVKQNGFIDIEDDAYCIELTRIIAAKLRESDNQYAEQMGDVKTLRTELFKDCETREFVYKDNHEDQWIRINFFVIERNDAGVARLLILLSIVDDIRAQKMEADRLIASQKADLEDRQKMLLEAINEVSSANKAKTDFFSNMSHDIRTPMNAIQGFSKLAVEEIDNKEHLKDYLDKIVNASDHLLNLINNILDMSRIESGKMDLVTSPVKIRTLLTDCADMISVKMEEKDLRFVIDIDDIGDDVVACDRLHFNQVILNLLSNAYKFTPDKGSVFLTGKLLEEKNDLTYEIRVRDTGVGMSEEFSRHIWEEYSREKTQMTHETQGTGLGMVIVKNIVSLMGGTIDLVTEQGKGTEFIIVLSFKKAEADEETPEQDSATENLMNKDFSGVTVLVVDDTAVNLKLADRLLSKHGFKVISINSGIKAIQLLEDPNRRKIDIILMDVLMPVMDGYEATRQIRAMEDPEVAGIPIIAMTANAFDTDVKNALDAGMNAHVPKPFKMEDLLAKIDKFL